MAEVLSQNEVSALLDAVNDGIVETEDALDYDPSQVVAYNLTSQDRIILSRMPTLDIINDRLCRMLRHSLSNALRQIVEVSVKSSGLIQYGEFSSGIEAPACLNLINLTPLRGLGIFSIDPKLFFTVLSFQFGARKVDYSVVKGRELTVVELRLVHRLIELLIEDFQNAWRPVVEFNLEFLRTEINPQFAAVVQPTDVVLRVKLEIEVGDNRGGLTLIVPYSSIEAIKGKLTSATQTLAMERDPAWSRRMRHLLLEVMVNVTAEFGRAEVSVRDLLALQVGDVLVLDRNADEPSDLLVEGKPKFLGFPAVATGALVIQVMQPVPASAGEEGKE